MLAVDQTHFRQWRREMKLTQRQAAKMLGYGVSRVAEFDRGERDPPRAVEIAMRAILLHPDILKDAPHENLRQNPAPLFRPAA